MRSVIGRQSSLAVVGRRAPVLTGVRRLDCGGDVQNERVLVGHAVNLISNYRLK